MDTQIHMLPIGSLRPNPNNPRRNVGDVTDLAESIKAQGIRQNLLVIPDNEHQGPNDSATVYRIVIGHRRYAAAKQAGLTHLPCVIADLDPKQERELMLVENTQRADLTPLEEADGYQGLLDLGSSVKDMADKTGRSQTFVRQRLKLAGIGQPTRKTIQTTQPTVETLIALSEFNDHPDLQDKLAEKITEDGTISGYDVQRTREAIQTLEWFQAADDYCTAHNLTVTDFNGHGWQTPDGYEQTHRFTVDDGPFADQYETWANENTINDDAELFAYRNTDYYWTGIRLMTPSGADTDTTDNSSAYDQQQEQREKEQERKANRTAFLAFRKTSSQAREQYIHDHILHNHGNTTDQQITDALHDATTWLASAALANSCGGTVKRCAETYDRIMRYVGVPVKTGDGRQWPSVEDYEQDLRQWRPRRTLTAILILMESMLGDVEWCSGDHHTAKTLYRILKTCGYPTSHDERQALNDHWNGKPGAMGNL